MADLRATKQTVYAVEVLSDLSATKQTVYLVETLSDLIATKQTVYAVLLAPSGRRRQIIN